MSFFLKIPPQSATDVKWTQKDGTPIAVCEMTEQHAKNALRVAIKRIENLRNQLQAQKQTKLTKAMLAELDKDMHQD